MRHADGPLTSYDLLAALDRRIDAEGHILRVPREQAVFVDIFLRTFKIASLVALFCALLGYPVAYLLASLPRRSEEHTSELQSLMRISYAVFCLKKKTTNTRHESYEHKYTIQYNQT